MLRGAQQQGDINYNLRLAELDKERLIQDCQELHNEVKTLINDMRNNGHSDEEITSAIENNKEEYEKKYEYLNKNLPESFKSIISTLNYKIDILIMMIEELYKMAERKSGGQNVSMKIANALHKEFTDK